MKINVFLPCKKSSSRVKNKNKRRFADEYFGLIKIKLNQLLKTTLINNIYVSTNDKKIIKLANSLKKKKLSFIKELMHLYLQVKLLLKN